MVMTSHQVAGIIGSQQAMFGNFLSYAQQITPPFAGPQRGYGQPQQGPGYGSPYGVGIGMAPPPPPMPVSSYMDPYAMSRGFPPSMYGMAPGMMGGGDPSMMGERLTGMGLNAGRTLGNAAGWVNTGAGIASLMGIGGAGMALAGGLPAMGAVMAGGYAMNQMGAGFQERSAVNRALRSNFGGMMGVGGGRGGYGFSDEEMGGVSQMVRQMGTQDLLSNTEELTRVLDRTSQMGLYRGVRSAQDFKDRFRQITTTLRDISQTLGTTLEEATSFMDQSRGMGFFSGRDISANLLRSRMGAAATGMSMGQVQQMGMVGAQVGRSMGMRGRVGAQAMQNAGLNIAMGMQMGVFSDEAIADATGGLTGAEGATAMAQRIMEINQNFLQRGEGRVALAALWDPNTGGIRSDVMRQLQSGQISFRELRTMGRQNIRETGGRMSQFWTQERRLRGMAMQEGGSALMMGAVEEHFGRRRGMSLEDPGVQRFLEQRYGISQDEIEILVQEQRNMPRIVAQRESRARQEMENMARTRAAELTGVKGIERRMGRYWETHVENPFRQVGDELSTSVSKAIQNLSDAYEGRVQMQMSAEAKHAYQELAAFGTQTTGKHLLLGKDYDRALMSLQRRAGGAASGGLLARGAEWFGGVMGVRSTESPEVQGERLGLGVLIDGKLRLPSQVVGGKRQRGDILQGSALRSRIMQAQETMLYGTAGFTDDEIQPLALAAAAAISRTYGGSGNRWERAVTEAGTSGSRQLVEKRISELSSADPSLRAAFAKIPAANFAERVALLRRLEDVGGVSKTTLASPVYTLAGGVNTRDLAGTLRMVESEEARIASNIASMQTGSRRTTRVSRTGAVLEETTAVNMGLSGGVVRDLFQNDVIRQNLEAVVSGTPEERTAALTALNIAARQTDSQLTTQQSAGLKKITGVLMRHGGKEQNELKGMIKEYLHQETIRSSTVLREREAELGRSMAAGLQEGAWRFAEAGGEKALATLQQIAKLRSDGSIEEALKLERKFMADPSVLSNAGIQKAIAGTRGLEYVQAGITETQRYQDMLRSGRGGTATGRLIQSALKLYDVSGPQTRESKQMLEAAVISGDRTEIWKQLGMLGVSSETLSSMKAGGGIFDQLLGIGKDKLTGNEQATAAAILGSVKASGARLEGGREEVAATSKIQMEQLSAMKKQTLVLLDIARTSGKTSDKLAQIQSWAEETGPGQGKEKTT